MLAVNSLTGIEHVGDESLLGDVVFFLDEIHELAERDVAAVLGILGEEQNAVVPSLVVVGRVARGEVGEENGGGRIEMGFAIFGDDSEEVEEGPLVVNEGGLGGELGVEVGEGEGFGGPALGGEAALYGFGDGGGVGGDGGSEAAREDAEGVAEGVFELRGVRV